MADGKFKGRAMKGNCRCIELAGLVWYEQQPESKHRYRVQCARCNKFAKWGAQTELDELKQANAKFKVVPYSEPDTIMEIFNGSDNE